MSYPTTALSAHAKTRVPSIFIAFAFVTFLAWAPASYGQASLTFTGGSSTPLRTTLNRSVVYSVNTTGCGGPGNGPFIEFDEVGNILGNQTVTGSIAYSVNGGPAIRITNEDSGFVGGNVTANDHSLYNNTLPGVFNGSTVVLYLGPITTNGNIAAARPANGNYTTFLTDLNGLRCSTNGVAFGPTAASVTVSGRVLTENGNGLRNAQVTLTDAQGNVRQARTLSFGYYLFEDVTVGETVVVSVRSKLYQFAQRVITVSDNVSDLDFIAGQ